MQERFKDELAPSRTTRLQNGRRAFSEKIGRDMLTIIDALTPPSCKVCSTREILVALDRLDYRLLTIPRITGHLKVLEKRRLVEGKFEGRLHLWSLTKVGRDSVRAASK